MRIAVDLDDVLADLIPYLVRTHAALTGEYLTDDDITGWDSFLAAAHDAARYEGGYEQLDPLPGARGFLEWLRHEGHQVFIVTYRSEQARAITEAWLATHTGAAYDALHLVGGLKGATCVSLGIELIIDDSLTHIRDVTGKLGIPAILVETPMNRKASLPEGVRRARGLAQVRPRVATLVEYGGRWPVGPSGYHGSAEIDAAGGHPDPQNGQAR